MARTIKELASEALRVQDACNLWAVVNGFSRALGDLDEHCKGSTERDNHPVAKLWADKVTHLTGTQTIGNDGVMAAFEECMKLVESD